MTEAHSEWYDLYNGDCMEVMRSIPDDSVDMVLCDLPYGTTDNRWDSIIPFGFLSEQYRRVCKREAAILLFAAPPFSYKLGMSELRDLFRFQYVWIKNRPTGAAFSHYQPMRKFEDILVFSKSGCSINLNSKKPQTLMNYFPVMGFGKMEKRRKAKWKSENYHAHRSNYNNEQSYYTCAKWPDNVLVFDCAAGGGASYREARSASGALDTTALQRRRLGSRQHNG